MECLIVLITKFKSEHDLHNSYVFLSFHTLTRREPGKELDTKEEAEQVLLDTVIHEMFA